MNVTALASIISKDAKFYRRKLELGRYIKHFDLVNCIPTEKFTERIWMLWNYLKIRENLKKLKRLN